MVKHRFEEREQDSGVYVVKLGKYKKDTILSNYDGINKKEQLLKLFKREEPAKVFPNIAKSIQSIGRLKSIISKGSMNYTVRINGEVAIPSEILVEDLYLMLIKSYNDSFGIGVFIDPYIDVDYFKNDSEPLPWK